MAIAGLEHVEIVENESGESEARIVGTQIIVREIVVMHVMNDSSLDWISENYNLSLAQIHAALSYYYDHQAEMDIAIQRHFARANAMVEAVGTPLAEVIARMQARQDRQG